MSAALSLLVAAGCASPQPIATEPRPESPASSAEPPSASLAQRDPIAYLHAVAAKTATLTHYTVLFTRQERRGLGPFRSLQAPEAIQCWFRREPFSVRMKWLDPDIKYGESTYVEGQERNKVRFVPRYGLFGLPPGLVRVNVMTPVAWGESRYPVSEFGLEKLMKQTLETLARFPAATVWYGGPASSPFSDRDAHRIRIDYPLEGNPAPVQELYFDVQTHLPLATVMLFPDGSIDTAYGYANLDTNVRLSDADFLLDAEAEALGVLNARMDHP